MKRVFVIRIKAVNQKLQCGRCFSESWFLWILLFFGRSLVMNVCQFRFTCRVVSFYGSIEGNQDKTVLLRYHKGHNRTMVSEYSSSFVVHCYQRLWITQKWTFFINQRMRTSGFNFCLTESAQFLWYKTECLWTCR